ncbi:MAG: hypothetical protein JST44_24675 [Cyanobacteria bacterium SZAS LIN-5]|nr:hypothetical protein [Cyanobacteria bacterium SZAS LIN-5]RTL45374.1 MAG: hypothetical protein EKK48_02755 [Candidatus Melainabacteria bacterium]
MHHGGGGGAGHGHGGHHSGHGHGTHHHHHHHGGAPSSSASWNMAMQADSFWVNMLKANSKPLLVMFGVIGAMFGWLCLLHYLHHKDSPDHVVSNAVWNQQLTAVNPHQAMPEFSQSSQDQALTSPVSSAPAAFGSPRTPGDARGAQMTSGYGEAGGNVQSSATRPSLAPLMFSSFMPGGYQSQAASGQFSAASMYAPSTCGSAGSSQQLMPTRVHSSERFRMVVSR